MQSINRHEYWTYVFGYISTIFWQHNMPGLELIANDKLLFISFHSL